MEYKKTLTGILAGTAIGLSSLFHPADAISKDKTYVAESSYIDTTKGIDGEEVVIKATIEGKPYTFTFEHNLKGIITLQSARFYIKPFINGDTKNIKVCFGDLRNALYVLEIMPTAKDRLPETKVTRLSNAEVAGNKAKGYTFIGMDNIEYFVNMKTGGISKYNRLPVEQTVEIEGENGKLDNISKRAGEAIIAAITSGKKNPSVAAVESKGIKQESANNKFKDIYASQQEVIATNPDSIIPKSEVKTSANKDKTEITPAKEDTPKKIIPVNMLGKTSEDAPKKIDVDAGYSSLLDIDVGYTPDVESISPFIPGEKENYTAEAKTNKSRAVLDEEAAGCGCTDLFKGMSESKYTQDSIVEKEDMGIVIEDAGIIAEADAGFDLDAGMISEIDAAVDKTDANLFDAEKTVYDAGIVDIGVIISDAGVDSGVKDANVEPALEPISKECKVIGLANYFVANKGKIIGKMYEGEKELKYFKGNFVFSGSLENGRFKNVAVNLDKTTLEKGRKEKLEKILFNLQDVPTPKKDQDCRFDEITLKF